MSESYFYKWLSRNAPLILLLALSYVSSRELIPPERN